ncbi:hypothetical protein MSAN_01116100 [Mycena sanguinolenta]|uniref:Uncharacterized protein n=1 Tax=Mycena sanguinolenta TaxID=230812 RepID=A0A8H7D475_9AGAR|nr:hypothetical protein MSAN_01116100 [Mycena sanguinolenta]
MMCEPEAFHSQGASNSWRITIQLNVINSLRIILDALMVQLSTSHDSLSGSSLRTESELLALRTRLLAVLDIEDVLKCSLATPDAEDEAKAVLHARCADMQSLWHSPTVRAILDGQGIRLQESPGFFLDELHVVTSPEFVPTDDHILRARLAKTSGVSEHHLHMTGCGITGEFRFFSIDSQRSMRTGWVPYFDDVDALIFLVPISAFDQVLAEDSSINRLADSVDLWTSIMSNKLLQNTKIILFLTKVDLLHVLIISVLVALCAFAKCMQAKLTSGVRFADYIPSYGGRANDFDTVSRYLRKQFCAILKEESPTPRIFYCHMANIVDAKSRATSYVVAGVKDMLMRSHLTESRLVL